MKKKILIVSSILALSMLAVTGCGAKKTDATETASIATDAPSGAITPVSTESPYIGKTVSEFLADGNEIFGYGGASGQYIFSARNTSTNTGYTLEVEENIVDIMTNKTADDTYEGLIGHCKIAKMKTKVANDEELQKYIGKTLADLEADSIKVTGFLRDGDSIIFVCGDVVDIYVTYDKEEMAGICSKLEKPKKDDYIAAFRDCPIASIYYVLQ